MKKILCVIAFGMSTIGLLAGCTTAMYTAPSAIATTPNTYNFTIETGGFSGATTADQRAVTEINKFMTAHGYLSYKILHRTDEFIPSGYKYTVQFRFSK